MIHLDHDLPGHRAKVSFRGQTCFVLSADKIASDRKNFREIAGMLQGGSPRQSMMAAWLMGLDDEYAG